MRYLWLFALASLAACEPPPAVDDTGAPDGGGDPTVTILFPPADVTSIPLQHGDTDDGEDSDALYLKVLLVVDFDNYEFVEPGSEPGIADEPSAGHYHFYVNNVYNSFPLAQHHFYVSDPNEFQANDNMSLSVKLASHNHVELTGEGTTDVVEFVVANPD